VILGLRLRRGLDLAELHARCGVTIGELYADGAIESLVARGLLARNGDGGAGMIRLTERGLELADEVFVELV
jgi:coproporphyrinogen III oxidase-like Fe-S oxidoreductase